MTRGVKVPSIAVWELSPWVIPVSIGAIMIMIIYFQLLGYLVEAVREKIWIPWTVSKFMRGRGFSGPSFTLLSNNDQEMEELTVRAAGEPIHREGGISHDFMPRVMAPIHTWRNLYGDKFIFKQGSRVVLHVSDPEAIKEIFSNIYDYGKCTDRALSFELVGSHGLGFAEPKEWASQRRMVRPAFYLERSKQMVGQMASWIEMWLQRLDNLVVDNGGEFDTDMSAELEDLTKDILARSSFGSSFAKGKEAFRHQENQKRLLLQKGLISTASCRWRPVDLNKEISKEKCEVLRCLREIIQDRRNSIQSGIYESYGDDLLGLLLADRDRRLASDGRPPGELETEDEHITDQLRSFFFAGFDLIHTALSWATVLLSHHTDWQERIRAEVQEAFQGASPDGDHLLKLKQLEMFVEETLRLYSPASAVYREVVKSSATLLGEPVPKHLVIMMNMLGVHRDKQYWGDDALELKPMRFAKGKVKACKKPFGSFNPFGGGLRICVAQEFALIELKLVLAMLLLRFSLHPSCSYRHEPILSMTLQPRFGVQVVLEHHQNSNQQK